MYDYRNLSTKVSWFPGHVNSHQKLQMTLVENSVLISPGSDHFVRAWSLSSGALLWQKTVPGLPVNPIRVRYLHAQKQNPTQTCSGLDYVGFYVSHGSDISFWSRE